MQCLAEFYSGTTRKRFLAPERAASIVSMLIETLEVVPAELPDLLRAMNLQRLHGLQTFDALLLATALRAGCTLFLSEDLQHGRAIEGITIINPFNLTGAELDQLLT
jgi:predicted nucleic acid-binding protein